MDTARIAALLEPFLDQSLPESQLEQISIYIDLLLRWNARINLTAIRKEEEIVTRHFGESFFMARHLFPADVPDSAPVPALDVSGSTGYWVLGTGNQPLTTDHCTPRVLDIGSGAGFPALPLKIWAPHIHLTLVESNHKKAAFLREVARALTLTNINVITDRAETLAARPDFPRADVVTLRAVEHFETILPQAVTFLAPNGTLALLIGAAQIPRLTPLTTLQWRPPIPVPKSHSRVLSIGVHKKSGKQCM
ncbi:MAG: 16S rRNA (guanine(527)-N(7))-methyltransferase RsmG [Terriglobales bacterium]|jgi:16S rRNA (guanine527-N7)-methyltransferase